MATRACTCSEPLLLEVLLGRGPPRSLVDHRSIPDRVSNRFGLDARLAKPHRHQESVENRLRARGTTGNVDVHRHHTVDAPDGGIRALAEDPARAAAGADRD